MIAAWNVGLANENHSHLGAPNFIIKFGPVSSFSRLIFSMANLVFDSENQWAWA